MYRITHSADIQIKNRKPLFHETREVLSSLVAQVRQLQSTTHIIAGDLFEYAIPTDSERTLIYNHIVELLAIDTLKEIVIIAGNHDLVKQKNQNNSETDYNAIQSFVDSVKPLDTHNKIRYFRNSGVYQSTSIPGLDWVAYSLEDSTVKFSEIKSEVAKQSMLDQTSNDRFSICLYHAMLREYCIYDKLPLTEKKLNELDSIVIFPANSVICAGDIHKTLSFQGPENQIFNYPGSTMQHTFGEGTYHFLDGDKLVSKTADSKCILAYDFDETSKKIVKQACVYLPSFIEYTTIEFGPNQINIDKLSEIKFNTAVTNIIKIKSNSTLLSKEHDIRKIIVDKFVTGVSPTISFVYDKLTSGEGLNGAGLATYVESVIAEKSIDSNSILSQETIDSLVLNHGQIIELFKSGLSNIFDVDVATQEEVVNLFIRELNEIVSTDKRANTIQFDSISTGGFMLLGPSQIDFSNGQLTRILGTNGVGKTTIYKMLRWVLTGQISESMVASKVVQNTLLIFNKNLIDSNLVSVNLHIHVNNVPFVIKRAAARDWKSKITDEQKLENDWQQYVAGVRRQLVLINQETNEEFTDNEAQTIIDSWFGQTINNLLFINGSKIQQILNKSEAALKELILQYLGVDYIEKFEQRLNTLKDDLFDSVSKPKATEESIEDNIASVDADINVVTTNENRAKAESESIRNKITSANQELRELTGKKQSYIVDEKTPQEQIEFHQSKNDELKSRQEQLESLDQTKREILDPYSVVTPPEDLTEKIDTAKSEITETQTQIEGYKTQLEETTKKRELIETKWSEFIQQCLDSYNSQHKEISQQLVDATNECTEYTKSLVTKCEEKRTKVETAITNLNETIVDCNVKLSKTNQKIDENKQIIETGVCPQCGQKLPQSCSDNDIDTIKRKIEEFEAARGTLEAECTKNENSLKRLEDAKNILIMFISNPENATEEVRNKLGNGVIDFDEYDKIKDKKSQLTIDLLNINYAIKTLENHKERIEASEALSELIDSDDVTKYHKIIDAYATVKVRIDSIQSSIESTKTVLEERKNNRIELEQKQIDDRTFYNNEISRIQKENQEATEYNKSIEANLNEIDKIRTEIDLSNQKVQHLQETILPRYEQVLEQIISVENDLKQYENDLKASQDAIIEIARKRSNYEHIRQTLNDDLVNVRKYKHLETIWKVYSKMIKQYFKEIVFDYYRIFINNTLSQILDDVPFKLYWNDGLKMVTYAMGADGVPKIIYQTVSESSGMETTFLGLSLIYALHILNINNSVSHMFIDEISGTLNNGNNLSYVAENYQELFKKLIHKFTDKSIFIIDHAIEDFDETVTYEVIPNEERTLSRIEMV